MKKRLISMALAVSMAVSIMPAPALATVGGGGKNPSEPDPVAVQASDAALTTYATQGNTFTEGNLEYTITKAATVDAQGEVKVSGCERNLSGNLTIPDTVTHSGQAYKVTSIGSCAFQKCIKLSSVTISDNVTSIEMCAFDGCTSLTNVTISSGMTEIGYLVFGKCTSLKNVEIPSSVTSIGTYAFSGCTGLTNVTIPSSVTKIGYGAFCDCSSLPSVTIPSSVESIGDWAFKGCTSLSSVTIPSSVKSIGDSAFRQSGLTSVTIPSSVESIHDYAFYDCIKLSTIYYTGTSAKWRSFNQSDTINSKVCYVHTLTLNNPDNIVVENGDNPVNDPIKFEVAHPDLAKGKDITLTIKDPDIANYTYKWEVTGATANVFADTASCTLNVKDEDVTVSLTRIQKLTVGDLIITFPDGEYDGTEKKVTVTDKSGNDISCEITYTKEGETGGSTDAPKDAGTYKVTITIKGGEHNGEVIEAGSFTIASATYNLTVKNAEVTVKDADGKAVEFTKAEDGTLTAKVPENAEVTVKYTAPTDAIVFDLWSINSDAKLDVNVKENPLTFRMPTQAVTIEAMTQDATIESEGPGVLGTAAMIGVAGAGTAVLGYTGYMIGTELYLNTVLPAGAAIPQNTTELAKLLWTEAGKPAPAAVMAEDATDEQKALTWAVESQLISADKPADASVGRWEVIRGWNRVKEMK